MDVHQSDFKFNMIVPEKVSRKSRRQIRKSHREDDRHQIDRDAWTMTKGIFLGTNIGAVCKGYVTILLTTRNRLRKTFRKEFKQILLKINGFTSHFSSVTFPHFSSC